MHGLSEEGNEADAVVAANDLEVIRIDSLERVQSRGRLADDQTRGRGRPRVRQANHFLTIENLCVR